MDPQVVNAISAIEQKQIAFFKLFQEQLLPQITKSQTNVQNCEQKIQDHENRLLNIEKLIRHLYPKIDELAKTAESLIKDISILHKNSSNIAKSAEQSQKSLAYFISEFEKLQEEVKTIRASIEEVSDVPISSVQPNNVNAVNSDDTDAIVNSILHS